MTTWKTRPDGTRIAIPPDPFSAGELSRREAAKPAVCSYCEGETRHPRVIERAGAKSIVCQPCYHAWGDRYRREVEA